MSDAPSPPAVLKISAWGLSDVGRRRERNEDSFCWDDALQLYVVADGMGGHVGGGLASHMAVTTIVEVVRQFVDDPDATVEDTTEGVRGRDPRRILQYAVEMASRRIYLRSIQQPNLKGMGTTVVVLWIQDGVAYLGNVGDSRGYLIRGNAIKQLTVDHSLVGEQMRAGILSRTDAKTHRYKNIITRSVGFQDTVDLELDVRPVRPGDTMLLCSDGLTNMVDDAELCRIVASSDLSNACQTLIETANTNGGDDNITLLLARAEHSDGSTSETVEDWDEPTLQL